MKHGDISNRTSFRFAINFEELVEFKKQEGIFKKPKLTLKAYETMCFNRIWRNTDFTFYIVCIFHNEKYIKKILEPVFYSSLLLCEDEDSLIAELYKESFDYYIDSNYNRQARISAVLPYTKCIDFQEFKMIT